MSLPPLYFSSVTVPPNDVDLDKWFPEATFSPQYHDYFFGEVKAQENSLLALKIISHMGKGFLKSIEPLQEHCSKYRALSALKKSEEICKTVSYDLGLDTKRKIVIFAWHRAVMTDLYRRLSDFKAMAVYQNTRPHFKEKYLRRFANSRKYRVLIVNVAAATTKIDLTAANKIFFAESSWRMEDNAQAVLRVHRIGQKRPVSVRWFGLKNDVDDKIQRLIKSKTLEILRNQTKQADSEA